MRTQYQWVTLRKRTAGWFAALEKAASEARVQIRRVTNAHSSEPVAAARGRFAAVSLWVEDLPEDCDLNTLSVTVAGQPARGAYLGPPRHGLVQFNIELPDGLASGLQPVEIHWLGRPLAPRIFLRVIPPPPPVPRVVEVSDGIDLLAGPRIRSRTVRVVLEEVEHPERFDATVGGHPIGEREITCADPRTPIHQISFALPGAVGPGQHELAIRIGDRRFPPVTLEVSA